MEIVDLRKEPIIIEWFQTANIKPRSIVSYIQGMRDFTEYTKKDPETLLEEAENEVRAGKLMRQRALKRHLVGFRQHLQDEGKAPMTIKNRIVGVKSFFETFDVEIPKLPRVGKAVTLEKNNDIPSKEDIQDVLKVADPLEKSIVLTGVSSGLAANEISNLKVKDFQKGYDPKTGITTLKLRREKASFDFITFLSPEASKAILDYLDYRNRPTNNPKQIYMLKKQKVYSDSDYLFIRRQVIPEYLDKSDENLRRLNTESITKVYRILSTKARKNTPLNEWSFIRSHNLRKYFNSTLLNAGADSFFTNFLMGHTLNETQAAYFRASPEKLKEIYLKFVPFLTIQKEADISESPEYIRIKQENQILQAETARHVVERSEIQELRAEMERMKETRDSMESIKSEYMQFADLGEMKNKLQQELEEISKLKETMLKAEK